MPLSHPNAGAIRSLLFGKGPQAIAQGARVVTETGARDLSHMAKPAGGLPSIIHTLRDVTVGLHPLEQIKQRLTQGGLVGRGGIVHGAFALDPAFAKLVDSGPLLNAIKKKPIEAMSAATNAAFLAGLPAYSVYKHHQRGESIGRSLGEGAGWLVGAPFGLAGNAAAVAGRAIGSQLLPEQQPPAMSYADYSYADPQEKVGSLEERVLPRIRF
jgi:hypothetical protein